jgi:hypothetical protein
LQLQAATYVSMRNHASLTERWLQDRLVEDPSLLGLGDLIVKDVERRQPRAGRLDLLLAEVETATRYEVEIQLGATDESHIIRTIEYWDLERRRYPQYDHVAVIVAEDITSRFLNIISLFNGFIPVIALQLRCFQVAEAMTLIATRVVDVMALGTDEEDEAGAAADRAYWETRASKQTMATADRMLELLHTIDEHLALKYNKFYVGLARSGVADNFVVLHPRKGHLIAGFRVPRSEAWDQRLDDQELNLLEYETRSGRYKVRISAEDVVKHHDLLVELSRAARDGTAV